MQWQAAKSQDRPLASNLAGHPGTAAEKEREGHFTLQKCL
jgi:hypothetical protein